MNNAEPASMRLLFIDVFGHYMNPTQVLMGSMAAAAARDITFFGPGFSTVEELDAGTLAFVEKTGPYDVVVTGAGVPLFATTAELRDASTRHWRRFDAFCPPPSRIRAFYDDVLAALPQLPIRHRIASLVNFDYYAATNRHTDILEALDAYIVAPAAQFVPKLEELPEWVWEEEHFQRKRNRIGSTWHEFLARRADRVLGLPHFIADQEFSFRGLADREARISAPGVEYVMRKRGLAALRARGIKPKEKRIFLAFKVAGRLKLPVFARFVPLRLYNMAYLRDLIDSRFTYTAPEGFLIPVRKFFEIPAAGSVMLCVPPHGFSGLGFRDGEHYVNVTPETLVDMMLELEADPTRAQAIASAGRKLVFERHSLRARGQQLAACLQAIVDGSFTGSTWEDGIFRVHTRANASIRQPIQAAG